MVFMAMSQMRTLRNKEMSRLIGTGQFRSFDLNWGPLTLDIITPSTKESLIELHHFCCVTWPKIICLQLVQIYAFHWHKTRAPNPVLKNWVIPYSSNPTVSNTYTKQELDQSNLLENLSRGCANNVKSFLPQAKEVERIIPMARSNRWCWFFQHFWERNWKKKWRS